MPPPLLLLARLPSANLFANPHSKLFPRLQNPQSLGQRLHLVGRAGWGVRAAGTRDAGIKAAGCGMRGPGCGRQGCEDQHARIRDVGCRHQDAGYRCPAPYRAMKVGPSEGLQLLPGIAGLPMCSLNIHRGVSPPQTCLSCFLWEQLRFLPPTLDQIPMETHQGLLSSQG